MEADIRVRLNVCLPALASCLLALAGCGILGVNSGSSTSDDLEDVEVQQIELFGPETLEGGQVLDFVTSSDEPQEDVVDRVQVPRGYSRTPPLDEFVELMAGRNWKVLSFWENSIRTDTQEKCAISIMKFGEDPVDASEFTLAPEAELEGDKILWRLRLDCFPVESTS